MNVRMTGGLWAERMETNRCITLPIAYQRCLETGRLDAFKLQWKPGQKKQPHCYWDSDVGKWIEAAAYSLAMVADQRLEKNVDRVIGWIEKAQMPDGYLNTYYQSVEPSERWTNLRDQHELYCAGHLIEAAIAYFETTGKRRLLDVMCRYVDHIDQTFGPRQNHRQGIPGHEEIELALVRLFRVTGNPSHLALASVFIERRGQKPNYFDLEARKRNDTSQVGESYEYNQAHCPVREQKQVTGHAVRAMYLYAGMADVALEKGDASLMRACRRLWQHLTTKRLHITGGVGPTQANEGFTHDYDLPNEGAYLETCAAIGLVFWAQRMLLADTNRCYSDTMERALYNGILSGVSTEGDTFFYGNPLAVHPGFDGNGKAVDASFHYRRSPWFDCACCPPNLARLIAQLPGLLYTTKRSELAVHLYAQSTGHVTLGHHSVTIHQQTAYPWKEKVKFILKPEAEFVWTLALRIPAWCRKATVRINGNTIVPRMRKGYACLRRRWTMGDRVELQLAMPIERVEAHPAARQNAGRIALQRGPVVYCLESVDNATPLNDLAVDEKASMRIVTGKTGILKGIPLVKGRATRRKPSDWKDSLYLAQPTPARQACTFTAVPYYLWGNRKTGAMLVWMRSHKA